MPNSGGIGGFGFLSTVSLRVAVMGSGFVLSMLSTRLLTTSFGVDSFAVYAIIVSILASLPFADLGLGAGVVNATSDFRGGRISRTDLQTVLRTTMLVLSAVSAILVCTAAALFLSGSWPALLALPSMNSGDSFAASLALFCVAASIPLGLGTRIYQGLQRTQTATALTFIGVGVQAATLATVYFLSLPAWAYAVGPALALLLTNMVTMILAVRALGAPAKVSSRLTGDALSSHYGFSKSAVPYLITLIGVTLTLQMQRILLSHASTPDEVASFSFAAQFSVAITSVVTLSSINLWPKFRDLRSERKLYRSTFNHFVRIYTLVGAAFGFASAVASFALASAVTDGAVTVSVLTAGTSGLSIFAWSVTRPAVMFLNSPSGFWLQATWAVPCAIVAVLLTLTLGATMGASGAFLASAVAVFSFTFIPLTIHSLRQIPPTR